MATELVRESDREWKGNYNNVWTYLSTARKSELQDTDFYRAMHYSAKRGIAIACRLSVCPSVCVSVRDCEGWPSGPRYCVEFLVARIKSLLAV